ncbi:MAG: hypothetical protein KA458_04980 [Saprospiraceae bacterium]|nr:hypothetical protein [Saprospiraceae bacterium]
MKKADLNFSFENYMRYRNLFNSAIKDVSFILNPYKIYLTLFVPVIRNKKNTPEQLSPGVFLG